MAKRYTPADHARLRKTLAEGRPMILGGAGDGFTAKLEGEGRHRHSSASTTPARTRHFGGGPFFGLMPVGRNQDMVAEYAGEVLRPGQGNAGHRRLLCPGPPDELAEWFAETAEFGITGFTQLSDGAA